MHLHLLLERNLLVLIEPVIHGTFNLNLIRTFACLRNHNADGSQDIRVILPLERCPPGRIRVIRQVMADRSSPYTGMIQYPRCLDGACTQDNILRLQLEGTFIRRHYLQPSRSSPLGYHPYGACQYSEIIRPPV
ncbi:hypothetical protein D3C81_1416130 [compost metagenome]